MGGGGRGSSEVRVEVEKGRWRHPGDLNRDAALARLLVFIVAVVQYQSRLGIAS